MPGSAGVTLPANPNACRFAVSTAPPRRIEKEVNLPGDLKIIVIRETRTVDYAV